MKGMSWFSAVLAIVAFSLAISRCMAVEQDDQEQAVRTFLAAYPQRNMPMIRDCAPTEPDDIFGAYPFAGLPTLRDRKSVV